MALVYQLVLTRVHYSTSVPKIEKSIFCFFAATLSLMRVELILVHITDLVNQAMITYSCPLFNIRAQIEKKHFCFFAASLSLVVVLAGVLGGLILTVAIILTILVCRRRRHSTSAKLRSGTGSDMAVVIKKDGQTISGNAGPMGPEGAMNRTTGLGSASTASTSDDDGAASNDSSELNKAEVSWVQITFLKTL